MSKTLLSSPADLQHTFAKELRDVTAEEKNMVVLECETERPATKVTWLKGMVVLNSSQKYLMLKKGVVLSLTIFNLEKGDSDLYTCDVGTMQSRALLTVQGKTDMQPSFQHSLIYGILINTIYHSLYSC